MPTGIISWPLVMQEDQAIREKTEKEKIKERFADRIENKAIFIPNLPLGFRLQGLRFRASVHARDAAMHAQVAEGSRTFKGRGGDKEDGRRKDREEERNSKRSWRFLGPSGTSGIHIYIDACIQRYI